MVLEVGAGIEEILGIDNGVQVIGVEATRGNDKILVIKVFGRLTINLARDQGIEAMVVQELILLTDRPTRDVVEMIRGIARVIEVIQESVIEEMVQEIAIVIGAIQESVGEWMIQEIVGEGMIQESVGEGMIQEIVRVIGAIREIG